MQCRLARSSANSKPVERLLGGRRRPERIVHSECSVARSVELVDSITGHGEAAAIAFHAVRASVDLEVLPMSDRFAASDGGDVRRHIDPGLNHRIACAMECATANSRGDVSPRGQA